MKRLLFRLVQSVFTSGAVLVFLFLLSIVAAVLLEVAFTVLKRILG